MSDAAGPPAARRTRRALFALGGAAGAALGLEAFSLAGAFDHRRRPAPGARARLRASLAPGGAPAVTHVGHSTHLIDLDGVRLLTDPWFNDPAFGALSHETAPAADPEDLGSLGALLISHDHPDHADLDALDRFPNKSSLEVLVGVPELARKLSSRGFRNVHLLAVWQRFTLGALAVHAVPAVHDVPEIGFVVEGSRARVFFGGDTAFHGDFPEIRERYRPSFAILPVDGTRVRGSERRAMTPPEAVTAARVLGVSGVMPSHAEAVFSDPIAEYLLTESVRRPRQTFAEQMARALPAVRCHLPVPGERVAL